MDEDFDDTEEITFIQRILRSIIDAGFHYLPQLAIVAVIFPVLVFVSLVAGWLVRSSVPVGWDHKVYLQYGSVYILWVLTHHTN